MGERAKSIVKLAATHIKDPMAKDWLTKDERGTWALVTRSLILAKKHENKFKKLTDEEIDTQIALDLISKVEKALKGKENGRH